MARIVAGRRVASESSRPALPDLLRPHDPYCFLVVPFDEAVFPAELRRDGIDAAAKRFGFKTRRVDEVPTSSQLIDEMRDQIARADFVIADITRARPNCYYELGYAHALGRPVIHIQRAGDRPHFDVQGFRILTYRDAAHLRALLENHNFLDVLTTQAKPGAEDPNCWAFGGCSFVHPYLVSARMLYRYEDDEHGATAWYDVDVSVRSVDPTRALRSQVRFTLHPTFSKRVWTVHPTGGIASLTEVQSYGSFTIGVEILKSGTRLELDLSRIPGSTAEFRAR